MTPKFNDVVRIDDYLDVETIDQKPWNHRASRRKYIIVWVSDRSDKCCHGR